MQKKLIELSDELWAAFEKQAKAEGLTLSQS